MLKPINQKFESLMQKNLPTHQATKAVVGWFYQDYQEVVVYGDFGVQVSEKTSFQIGSVSKLFTATLASIFSIKGTIDLKAHIGAYLQLDSASTIRAIILEDVLTHHSGLPSVPKELLGKYDRLNPYQHINRERLRSYLNSYQKPIRHNNSFQYSNLGFSILGWVLEEISGRTYEQLVHHEICQPLGIQDLWISQPKDGVNLASSAIKRKKELPRWTLNAFEPAGGIDAHIQDMLSFARGNLPDHPFYSMCAPSHQPRRTISKHLEIGLGWLITKHKDIGVLHSHNGATGGFNSFLGIHPAGRLGVVVLTNCHPSLLNMLGLAQDRATAIGYQGIKFLEKNAKLDKDQ